MMFSNKFVAAIKVDGKILRELKDSVYIPYGSEYSILLKNLESRKASVSVSIDGVDVGEGVTFVVEPNSELELKRFVKNKNLTEGNAFKFIERTEQIEEHRGVKLEDGL